MYILSNTENMKPEDFQDCRKDSEPFYKFLCSSRHFSFNSLISFSFLQFFPLFQNSLPFLFLFFYDSFLNLFCIWEQNSLKHVPQAKTSQKNFKIIVFSFPHLPVFFIHPILPLSSLFSICSSVLWQNLSSSHSTYVKS